MGKTSKPLRIMVTEPAMLEWPELQALVEQGHTLHQNDGCPPYDLVLGPRCWRMNEQLRPYLDLAIQAARAAVYPTKEKKA